MKKKIVAALLTGMALMMAGCGYRQSPPSLCSMQKPGLESEQNDPQSQHRQNQVYHHIVIFLEESQPKKAGQPGSSTESLPVY